MYRTRHQGTKPTSKFFVLTTTKTLDDGLPLTGKFYGFEWEHGETSEPLSYRDAMRVARNRGLQTLPWTESKAYKGIMAGTPAEPTSKEEVVEASTGFFESIREAAGVPKKKKATRRKKK